MWGVCVGWGGGGVGVGGGVAGQSLRCVSANRAVK